MNLRKRKSILLISILIITLIFYGYLRGSDSSALNHNPVYSQKDLLVHFIDVGQGDSLLIQINNKSLLIDAGPRESADKVKSYLTGQSVKRLNYIVATHPHEDHIGGMADVIRKFEVIDFYAPKLTSNTKTFENMINALKSKNLKINTAKSGVTLNLGDGITCEILAPVSTDYEDINNFSAVIKITHGQNKFIFTGDAEKLSEREMFKNNLDLTANVIKIGHHGSSSSSSKEFLEKVAPAIAVISSGAGNDYGHPHDATLSELKKRKLTVYRTDKDRDILLISDGKNITKE